MDDAGQRESGVERGGRGILNGFRMHERICAAVLCVAFAPYGVGQTQQQSAPPPAPDTPAQTTPVQQPPQTIAQQAQQAQPVAAQAPFHIELPHSRNPFAPYMPTTVPPINLTNSPRLQNLERD